MRSANHNYMNIFWPRGSNPKLVAKKPYIKYIDYNTQVHKRTDK